MPLAKPMYLSVLAGIVLAVSPSLPGNAARAEVVEYAVSKSPGIRTYWTHRAISKRWTAECTRQTSGRQRGSNICDLKPTDGTVFPRTGIYKSSRHGLKVAIREEGPLLIEFIPVKIQPGTSYSVQCGDSVFKGVAPLRGARGEAGFKGREAKKLLAAMKAATACQLSYVTNGRARKTVSMQTIGLTDAASWAEHWLYTYPTRD